MTTPATVLSRSAACVLLAALVVSAGGASAQSTAPLIPDVWRLEERTRGVSMLVAAEQRMRGPLDHGSGFGAPVRLDATSGTWRSWRTAFSFSGTMLHEEQAGTRPRRSLLDAGVDAAWRLRAFDLRAGMGYRAASEQSAVRWTRLALGFTDSLRRFGVAFGIEHAARSSTRGTTPDRPESHIDTLSTGIDTLIPNQPPPASALQRVVDAGVAATGSVHWTLGRTQLLARGWSALRVPTDSLERRRARLDGALEVRHTIVRDVQLAGTLASRSYSGAVPGAAATLGLRFTPFGHRVARLDGVELHAPSVDRDPLVLRIHAPHAASVEIQSDLSQWRAMPLGRDRARHWWRIELPFASGVHSLRVRIDGGPWLAPPGLPIEASDFGGESGVLVVAPLVPAR